MAHTHSGRSSKGFLDAGEIIGQIGVKAGDVFLDAGCGEGHFSIAAAQAVGGTGAVYALDIYEESINILKKEIEWKKIPNITARVADITKHIPLNDGIIDVCLMANILHGFVENGEDNNAMKEISRVIKPGGRLVVVDFKKMDGPPGPPKGIRLTPEDVERIAVKYGFIKEETVDAGFYTYMEILSKTGR